VQHSISRLSKTDVSRHQPFACDDSVDYIHFEYVIDTQICRRRDAGGKRDLITFATAHLLHRILGIFSQIRNYFAHHASAGVELKP